MITRELSSEVQGPDGGAVRLHALLHEPGRVEGPTLFCLPGGGSTVRYFDLGEADGFDFSFARRMAARGHPVLVMDHPGVGMNALPPQTPFFTPRQSAAMMLSALVAIAEAAGLERSPMVGVGHSMGGMLITLMQAAGSKAGAKPFAAIALLGSNAGGLDWGVSERAKAYVDRPEALEADLEALVLDMFGELFPHQGAGPRWGSKTFGGETEGATALLRAACGPLFAAGGMTSMVRGGFRPEAEALDVPLFMAFGEHDLGVGPHQSPAGYPSCRDFRVIVAPATGHNHFGFRTIETVCAELSGWAKRRTGLAPV